MICKICRVEFKSLRAISIHLRIHNINSKEYYDKFIKVNGEDECIGCGSKTNFKSMTMGYFNFCSVLCANSNEDLVKQKALAHSLNHPSKKDNFEHWHKGKTFEEIYGEEKSNELKYRLSEIAKINNVGENNPFYGKKVTEEMLEKYKQTSLERYGSEHYMKTNKGREEAKQRFIENPPLSPSKPQLELYKLVKQLNDKSELEFNCLNYFIDIAIPDKLIAIEYDGSFWHDQRKEYDLKRQEELEEKGWKFIRYVDRIPSIDELQKDLSQIE